MQKRFAGVQVAIGLVGILLCSMLYARYANPMQNALARLDEMAGDARIQADIGHELLDEWSAIGGDLEMAAMVHQRSLDSLHTTSRQLANSLQKWESVMQDSSDVSRNVGQVARKFANYLPLKLPDISMDSREVQFDIPQITLTEQEVKLPYPTVSVGSRSKEIDLGVTSIQLDVPTLDVNTRNRIVTVPATPNVQTKVIQFSVPENIEVTYHELLGDEKQLLVDAAEQLDQTAAAMADSVKTLKQVRAMMSGELPDSIAAGQSNLVHASAALKQLRVAQIPAFQARLRDQSQQLTQTQTDFSNLRGMVPWLFVLAGIVPLAIVVHGLRCYSAAGS
ncbi:MAG: hypothetical protein R3C53_23065 [Pirellulaceae bacterium]